MPAPAAKPTTTAPSAPPAANVTAPGPIDRLVERLSASHGLWQNGTFPDLGLPGTASTDAVVARVFEMTGFDAGHVKEHRIVDTRQVHIPGSVPDTYTACVVETDMGTKIVLLQYQHGGSREMWWSRVYDASTSSG